MMVCQLILAAAVVGGTPSAPESTSGTVKWFSDYGQAMSVAERNHQMLLVEFYAGQTPRSKDPVVKAFDDSEPLKKLARRYVRVRISQAQQARVGGESIVLSNHGAFAELQGQPGLAIVDFTNPKSPQYGYVVSIYPFSLLAALSVEKLTVLLDLPPGSLTQRTLIFAVRTNPEHPASATGQLFDPLVVEAESQAAYQASATRQGHQHWETRFHRINRRLPDGLMSQEVCAESWPGQGLIEAALECVHSWRQSPGHWNAVRSSHRFFGYDMKRGRNGVWYATGIFSTNH